LKIENINRDRVYCRIDKSDEFLYHYTL